MEIIACESSRQNRISASESDFNEKRQEQGFAVKTEILYKTYIKFNLTNNTSKT